MNIVKTVQRQMQLHRLQNLRSWLERLDLHGLYGHRFGEPAERECKYIQEADNLSRVILYADGHRALDISCFHECGQYEAEVLVRILDMGDDSFTPENYLLLLLFLSDELNGRYPGGYLVSRIETISSDVHLYWRQGLPLAALHCEADFNNFINQQLGNFIIEVLVPDIERYLIEFINIIKRSQEFDVDEPPTED